MLLLLLRHGHRRTAAMQCAYRGQVELVQWLVQGQNADVNLQDIGGSTALALAAKQGIVSRRRRYRSRLSQGIRRS
jgi:hypothetical protein